MLECRLALAAVRRIAEAERGTKKMIFVCGQQHKVVAGPPNRGVDLLTGIDHPYISGSPMNIIYGSNAGERNGNVAASTIEKSSVPWDGKGSGFVRLVFGLGVVDLWAESSRGSALTPTLEASEEEPRRKDETDSSRRAYRFSADPRGAEAKNGEIQREWSDRRRFLVLVATDALHIGNRKKKTGRTFLVRIQVLNLWFSCLSRGQDFGAKVDVEW